MRVVCRLTASVSEVELMGNGVSGSEIEHNCNKTVNKRLTKSGSNSIC